MQLEARWAEETIEVVRNGNVLANIPFSLVTKDKSWLKPNGNGKTEGMVGMISCLAGGCFRSATGFGKCDQACYCRPDGKGGCYANLTIHAEFRKGKEVPYNVIYNGLLPGTESWFKVKVPKNYDLSMYPRRNWRVDSETSTACLSLALGLMQRFAEANPSKRFTGISSDYFFVPDEALSWAARCGNIVVGHTVSSWFSPDDLHNRIEQALRFQRLGVPTVLWVATNPEWDEANPESRRLVDAAVGLFNPCQMIEVPYHDHGTHMLSSRNLNPWGECCTNRYTKDGRRLDADMTVDGEVYNGIPYGKCGPSCKVMCGASWLSMCQREEVS